MPNLTWPEPAWATVRITYEDGTEGEYKRQDDPKLYHPARWWPTVRPKMAPALSWNAITQNACRVHVVRLEQLPPSKETTSPVLRNSEGDIDSYREVAGHDLDPWAVDDAFQYTLGYLVNAMKTNESLEVRSFAKTMYVTLVNKKSTFFSRSDNEGYQS